MATLIKIGNSQGVRIPKAVIEQAKLDQQELEFKVLDEGLLIKPVRKPRQGWKAHFDKAAESSSVDGIDEEWLGAPLADDDDWQW